MTLEFQIKQAVVAMEVSVHFENLSLSNKLALTRIITDNLNVSSDTLIAVSGNRVVTFQTNVGFDFNSVVNEFGSADKIYFAHPNHSSAFKLSLDIISIKKAEKLASVLDVPTTQLSARNLVEFHIGHRVALNRQTVKESIEYFRSQRNHIMVGYLNKIEWKG